MRTDGTAEYCPDLLLSDGSYAENKSVGRNGNSIVYSGRAIKDAKFSANCSLYYVWWKHNANAYAAKTIGELRETLAASLQYVLILPHECVAAAILATPERLLNSQYARRHNGGKLG